MQRQIVVLLSVLCINLSCSRSGSDGGGGGGNPTPPAKGRIDFKLTDDPGQFAYFRIDITGLEYNESADPSISTGWINVPLQNTGIIDIIQYSNGREMPLGSLELLPVSVKQLRLKLGTRNSFAIWSGPPGGNFAFFDLPLHPSIVNGLVIPFTINVQSNNTNRIYFDFDAASSRVPTGSVSWQLLPKVRMFEAGQSSGIDGKVLPSSAKPYVRVIYLNHTSPGDYTDTAFGYPDATGYFKIIGLPVFKAIPDSVAGIQRVEFLSRNFSPPLYQAQEKLVQLVANTVVNTGTTTLVQ